MSYIKLQDAKNAITNCIKEQTVSKFATSAECKAARYGADIALLSLDDIPTADAVEVVRCKDCKHFQPCFVMTADGERRPYTEEEIKRGKMVTGDVGINCGSRCERFGYWEENKIPVWYSENDFCSYGERREE